MCAWTTRPKRKKIHFTNLEFCDQLWTEFLFFVIICDCSNGWSSCFTLCHDFNLCKFLRSTKKSRNLFDWLNFKRDWLLSVCHLMFCNGKSRSDWNVWSALCVCVCVWCVVDVAIWRCSQRHSCTYSFDITKRSDKGELHLYTPTSNKNPSTESISRIIWFLEWDNTAISWMQWKNPLEKNCINFMDCSNGRLISIAWNCNWKTKTMANVALTIQTKKN